LISYIKKNIKPDDIEEYYGYIELKFDNITNKKLNDISSELKKEFEKDIYKINIYDDSLKIFKSETKYDCIMLYSKMKN